MEILACPRGACAACFARVCLGIALAFVLAVFAPTPHTRAQSPADTTQRPLDAETRAVFDAGQTAFAAHRFEAALDAFERAHARSGRPAMLFNIGAAADRLGRAREALVAYEGYVAALPNAPNRRAVDARILALRESLGTSAPAVRERSTAATPATQATPPSAAVPARGRDASDPASAPATPVVTVRTEPITDANSSLESPAPPLAGTRVDRDAHDSSRARVVGTVATGLVLAGAGAALLTLAAQDRRSVEEADVGTSWGSVSDEYDRAPRRTAIGMTLVGAGAAATITGVALAIASRSRHAHDDTRNASRGSRGRPGPRAGFDGSIARERVEVSAWARF